MEGVKMSRREQEVVWLSQTIRDGCVQPTPFYPVCWWQPTLSRKCGNSSYIYYSKSTTEETSLAVTLTEISKLEQSHLLSF